MIYGELSIIDYVACVEVLPTFDDNSTDIGSGTIIAKNSQFFLCTVRHLLDPKYRPQNDGYRNASLRSCRVRVRYYDVINGGVSYRTVEFTTDEPDLALASGDNDAACIRLNGLNEFTPDDLRLAYYEIESVADTAQLSAYNVASPTYIIGYPTVAPIGGTMHNGGEERLPIVRQGILSTLPAVPLNVQNVLGSDYIYLDSFALSGFSGGPVIVPSFGIDKSTTNPIYTPVFRPKRIIGIMCGHLRSSSDLSDGLHSGLSYFCSSRTVLQMISNFE